MTAASRSRPVVALDGPAGAGKSTVSQRLADRLGFVRVDTGALYRAVAFAARERGLSWDDDAGVGAVARELARDEALRLVAPRGEATRVLLRGRDVTAALRTPELGQAASRVSALPAVRAALLDLQRQLGRDGGVVLEGRDIGTVVFPDAEVKLFLTASVAVRARRRYEELLRAGAAVTLAEVEREVEERDERDRTRALAPLRQAPDAVLVDSSDLTLDEVVEALAALVLRSAPGPHAASHG